MRNDRKIDVLEKCKVQVVHVVKARVVGVALNAPFDCVTQTFNATNGPPV